MSKNFKQNDSRWAKLGYPSGNDNMANSGCGCVACADLVVLNPKYANYTPIQVRNYMVSQGYAIKGKGTLFAGIVPTLEHFGLKAKWPDTMTELFNLLDKGPYDCGTLCMNAGTRGGVTWTTIGHFIAFTKYKKENGKHYFYIEDPGWRNNDGWFTYEDNMKGLVKHCYCAYVPNGKPTPEPEPKPTPSGKLKVDGVGGPETVKRLQEFLGCKSRDGVIGGQPISYKHLYPALKSVGFGSGGSQCITALQKWLGLSGPDGVLGKNTTSALQKKLRSLGYLPANESIDGVIGPKTMKALQEMLNNNGKKKGGTPTPDPKPTPSKSTKVIDVSEFQDAINWSKVKAAGIEGAIIRCGFRGATTGKLQMDAMFLNHIRGAHKAGVKCGIYMFTEAINEAEGREEADYAIKLWQTAGVPLYYPIAVDTEQVSIKGERARNLTKAQRTAAIKGFCQRIKERGYTPMIYASTSWLDSKLDMTKLPYDVWVAQYYKKCQYKGKYVMWQYTSDGKVAGVKGVVDLNRCYITPKKVNPPKDEPKPTPSGKGYTGAYPEVDRTKKLVDMAVKLAWAKGTAESKYKYPSGSATDAFKVALNKAYPNRSGWGAAPKVGASCDVFVGTVCRYAGLDSKFPRGLAQQFTYKPSWCLRYTYKDIAPVNKSQDGDIVMFEYDGGSHIIIRGNGMYYEANYSTYFGHTNASLARIRRKQINTIILRPKNYLDKGDTGTEVTKLQEYLNWYTDGQFFKECGKADGVYGNNTLKYVIKMQTDFFGAAEANGAVGVKTIEAMKKVRK